jgi:hypothetical protein
MAVGDSVTCGFGIRLLGCSMPTVVERACLRHCLSAVPEASGRSIPWFPHGLNSCSPQACPASRFTKPIFMNEFPANDAGHGLLVVECGA